MCNTSSENSFCAANNVREPIDVLALRRGQWPDVVQPPRHPRVAKLLAAVCDGGFALNDKRLSVLSMSEDGMSVTGETQWFASYGQRIRDVAVNPYTGAVYLASTGPRTPGRDPTSSNSGTWTTCL